MKQKLSIVTLGVSDLEKSKEFYCEQLQFTPSEDSNDSIIFFDMGGVLLGLFERSALADDAAVSSEGDGFRGVTMAHNEPSEDAVDVLFATLEADGVEIVKMPEKVFWGGYSGYFKDPDGHLWEVAYNPTMNLT